MDGRETVLRFLTAHYENAERTQLGMRAGIHGLPLGGASAEALMRAAERDGMAASLLACIEQDYPRILPALTWAGAAVDPAMPAEIPARPSESAAPPALTLHRTQPDPPKDRQAESSMAFSAEEAAALHRESERHPKPFRYVHGYNLPKHWARRDREMAELITEIHANRKSIIALTAIGGTGKSALTRKLLDELPACQIPLNGVLWFSFYVEPDFDRFLTEACRYVMPGFDAAAHPSPYEKSVLLREELQKARYLLVMDGIEVLQIPEKESRNFGAFHDRALGEFFEGLGNGTRSQIVISSRFPLVELEDKFYYHPIPLSDLPQEAADGLLVSMGVRGETAERTPLYGRFGTHALTMQVLGDLLARFAGGDPQAASQIEIFPPDAPQGIRLQAVLNAYWQHLNTDARFFLTRMAAFRGGVDERSLLILSRQGDHSSPEFHTLVQMLLSTPLVSIEQRDGHARLTAHPLIKLFFYERMADTERDQTHRALKDFAQGLPLPERPRTLEDYEPLLQACHHCLQVGLYTEAYQIYRRSNMDNALRWWGHYSQAISLLEPLREASLGTVPAWQSERWQKSWVENETALLALLHGDLKRAVERFQHSAQMDAQYGDALGESASLQNMASALIQRGDFEGALTALHQSRLLENKHGRFEKEDMLFGLEGVCQQALGNLQGALNLLNKAAAFSAQRSNARALCYWTWRIGDTLLQAGQRENAQAHYEKALKIAEHEPFRDYMGHSMRGLCDALRTSGDRNAARIYGTDALRIARTLGNPFLENEAALSLARVAEAEGNFAEMHGLCEQTLQHSEENGYDVQAGEAHLLLARAALLTKASAAFAAEREKARTLLTRTRHAATLLELALLNQA